MLGIKTLIIFCGMYYATPQWCKTQVPDRVKAQYQIYYLRWGTPITQVPHPIDYSTTALIGFSAGGLDVLKNYKGDWKLVGLIDPSCRERYASLRFTGNTRMIYNERNWGGTNSSMGLVARRINQCGGQATRLQLDHPSHFRRFFEMYL
jgi:hypothetical protein